MGVREITAPARRGPRAWHGAAPVLAVVVWLAAAPVPAQRVHIDTYAEVDGLPSSYVLTLTQDRLGRMWFATRTGIVTYDGATWEQQGTIPRPNPDESFTCWDDAAHLWVGSRAGPFRLRVFDAGTWSAIPPPPPPWSDRGISAIDAISTEGNPHVATATDEGDLLLWDGASWHALASGLPGAVQVVATRDRQVLALAGNRLWRSVDGEPALPVDGVEIPTAGAGPRLAIDKATGVPWLIYRDRVLDYDGDAFGVFASGLDLPASGEELARTVALDALGGLWAADRDRVLRIHPREGVATFTVRNGLISNGAVDLLRDREGLIWIATPRGVSKVVSLRFTSYGAEQGLHEDEVTAVLELAGGTMVLGHTGAISLLDEQGIRTRVLSEANRRARVLDLETDAAGRIWAAVESVGVAEISRDGSLRWHLGGSLNTHSVRQGPDGAIWVATLRGIFRGGSSGFERVSLGAGAAVEYSVRRILRADDTLYFASPIGLYALRDGTDAFFSNPDDRAASNVFAVLDDADGPPLVGTVAGLMRAVGGRLVPAGPEPPTCERPVYFLLRDRGRRLWIGTDNGVLRWDGKRQVHFSVEHGLIGRETNRAAGFVDSRGHTWIGTERGVSVYREEFDYETATRPVVTLMAAEADGAAFPLDVPVQLPHFVDSVTFGYRAVSLIDERQVRVQARLEGFDEDWLEQADPVGVVRYTSLPPGNYRLSLRAANADGNWSEPVESAAIVVPQPFWKNWWFYAALALGAMSLGWAAHRFAIVRREARTEENRRLEAELTRRQHLESLGVLAGGIAHDFNNLLTIVVGHLSLLRADRGLVQRHGPSLDSADTALRRARELTQQLLTFSHGGEPVRRPVALHEVVREAVSLALSGTNVRSSLDLPAELCAARIDVAQIRQVLHNLLINAAQAMPDGGNVRIVCRNRSRGPAPLDGGRWVEIVVSDDGAGIAPENRERVFEPYFSTKPGGSGLGLAAAHSIVTRHDGVLTVESPPGMGARFHVWLPATRAAAEPVETAAPGGPAARRVAAHVLVMDDEPAVREVVSELLVSIGCTVECADDGQQAIDLYADRMSSPRPFDVVLMDLTVSGGMGGREAMERLLAIDPAARAIVASGYSNDPVMAHHADYGFRACVTKPFGTEELVRVLKGVL